MPVMHSTTLVLTNMYPLGPSNLWCHGFQLLYQHLCPNCKWRQSVAWATNFSPGFCHADPSEERAKSQGSQSSHFAKWYDRDRIQRRLRPIETELEGCLVLTISLDCTARIITTAWKYYSAAQTENESKSYICLLF